jgi:hypothetical protein
LNTPPTGISVFERRPSQASALQQLWPRLIELWLLAVLATFFVIRILGSETGRRVLHGLRHHLP